MTTADDAKAAYEAGARDMRKKAARFVRSCCGCGVCHICCCARQLEGVPLPGEDPHWYDPERDVVVLLQRQIDDLKQKLAEATRYDHAHLFDWRWRKRGTKIGHLFNRVYVKPTSLCGAIRSATYLDTDVDYVHRPSWLVMATGQFHCMRCSAQLARLSKLEEEAEKRRARVDADATKLAMRESELCANGFEPVSEERRKENLIVNLGIAK